MTEHPVAKQQDAENERDQRQDRREAREPSARQDRAFAHRGDRWDARRAQCRPEACKQRDHDADEQADDHRALLEDGRRRREVEAEHLEERVQALREAEPEEEPGDRPERPDDEGLDHDSTKDLTAGRAERAQRCELANALRNRDRERVRDHEAANEERDAGEREQEVLDEAGEVDRLLVALLLRGDVPGLNGRRQDGPDLGEQLRCRHAAFRLNADDVEPALAVEEHLRRRDVEDGHRRAADRDAGELHDSHDAELLDRAAGLNADRVADLVVLVARRAAVDCDLLRAARPSAGREHEGVEALIRPRLDAEGEVGRAVTADELAVAPHQLGLVVGEGAGCRLHVRQGPDLREQRLREARRLDRVAVCVGVERGLAADHDVGVLVRLRDDRVEGAVHRVRQDERAAHHRDAEHDRERCQ